MKRQVVRARLQARHHRRDQAATVIQRIFRGHCVRIGVSALDEMDGDDTESEATTTFISTVILPAPAFQHSAAIVIQAACRGFRVRADLATSAATVIQKCFRGHRTRVQRQVVSELSVIPPDDDTHRFTKFTYAALNTPELRRLKAALTFQRAFRAMMIRKVDMAVAHAIAVTESQLKHLPDNRPLGRRRTRGLPFLQDMHTEELQILLAERSLDDQPSNVARMGVLNKWRLESEKHVFGLTMYLESTDPHIACEKIQNWLDYTHDARVEYIDEVRADDDESEAMMVDNTDDSSNNDISDELIDFIMDPAKPFYHSHPFAKGVMIACFVKCLDEGLNLEVHTYGCNQSQFFEILLAKAKGERWVGQHITVTLGFRNGNRTWRSKTGFPFKADHDNADRCTRYTEQGLIINYLGENDRGEHRKGFIATDPESNRVRCVCSGSDNTHASWNTASTGMADMAILFAGTDATQMDAFAKSFRRPKAVPVLLNRLRDIVIREYSTCGTERMVRYATPRRRSLKRIMDSPNHEIHTVLEALRQAENTAKLFHTRSYFTGALNVTDALENGAMYALILLRLLQGKYLRLEQYTVADCAGIGDVLRDPLFRDQIIEVRAFHSTGRSMSYGGSRYQGSSIPNFQYTYTHCKLALLSDGPEINTACEVLSSSDNCNRHTSSERSTWQVTHSFQGPSAELGAFYLKSRHRKSAARMQAEVSERWPHHGTYGSVRIHVDVHALLRDIYAGTCPLGGLDCGLDVSLIDVAEYMYNMDVQYGRQYLSLTGLMTAVSSTKPFLLRLTQAELGQIHRQICIPRGMTETLQQLVKAHNNLHSKKPCYVKDREDIVKAFIAARTEESEVMSTPNDEHDEHAIDVAASYSYEHTASSEDQTHYTVDLSAYAFARANDNAKRRLLDRRFASLVDVDYNVLLCPVQGGRADQVNMARWLRQRGLSDEGTCADLRERLRQYAIDYANRPTLIAMKMGAPVYRMGPVPEIDFEEVEVGGRRARKRTRCTQPDETVR
eukprot:COSAG01_NODE_2828_length_7002_cov_4.300014_3_plen_1013_part_00